MSSGSIRWPVYLIFFASGLASLVCEVVWFKQLGLIVGSSVWAMSVVVACFFTGLGLGSWLAGRLADRSRRRLRVYAVLELVLALVSAGVTTLLGSWGAWIGLLLPYMDVDVGNVVPMALGLGFLTLTPPAILMGATLPVLAKHLVGAHDDLARELGLLYGVNTLGAAIGCLLAGFVLIMFLGVWASGMVASGLYLVVGVVGLILDQRAGAERPAEPAPAAAPPAPAPAAPVGRELTVLLAVFAVSGFVAIAYEVLWFRLLVFFTIPSTYAFAAMLFTYLVGLVIGSWICAVKLAPRKQELVRILALTHLNVGAFALLALLALGRGGNLAGLLHFLLGWMPDTALMSRTDLVTIVLSFVVLVLPTTALGVIFPLTTEIFVQRVENAGARIGVLYAANTIGGVLGSLVTVFFLFEALGSEWTYYLLVLANIGLFLTLVFAFPALRGDRRLHWQAAQRIGVMGLILVVLGGHYLRDAQTTWADAELLAYEETPQGTYLVLGYDLPGLGRFQQILMNGTSYANNRPEGRRYMAHMAHLPVLLHPNPKTALCIAVGTGTTVGSLTLHPEVERVFAVDLSPTVFEVAPFFRPLNHDFTRSPKVRMVAADGRHFLLTTDERFDVITLEPPPPSEAGVVNLYSREFYRIARSRMNDDGLLAQWISMHNVGREEVDRMLVQTMLEEFPYVSFWMPNPLDGVAIGSNHPLRIDEVAIAARMARPELAVMEDYGLGRPEQLLATFMTADDALRGWVADAPVVTDDLPRVEQYNRYAARPFRWTDLDPHREPVEKYTVAPPARPEALARSVAAIEKLWSDKPSAREALALEPDNRYYQILVAEEERKRAGR